MANFLDAAIEIAREAGEVLMAHRGVAFELKGEHDLVTAADRASEALVIRRLQQRFPEHGIFAEEGGREALEAPVRWYIDPLDGTTNFRASLEDCASCAPRCTTQPGRGKCHLTVFCTVR